MKATFVYLALGIALLAIFAGFLSITSQESVTNALLFSLLLVGIASAWNNRPD